MELIVSAPTLASPTTSACEAAAWTMKDDMSGETSGWRTAPSTVPPSASTAADASRCIAMPNA